MKNTELRINNLINKDGNDREMTMFDFPVMKHNPKRYKPIPLTEEWLLKFGFEKKGLTMWKGNGYDYQPETNKTEQQDYYRNGFIIRFETWSYKKNVDDKWISDLSMQILNSSSWYSRISEDYIRINYDINHVHSLQNLYFALTQKELLCK